MDVQIFGVHGNADTRKALRFFKERRIKVHFVDLKVRSPSPGELRRFFQKFGAERLIDRGSRRFAALGLRSAHYGDERWVQLASDEPLILQLPLVRRGNDLTVGLAEERWRDWAG